MTERISSRRIAVNCAIGALALGLLMRGSTLFERMYFAVLANPARAPLSHGLVLPGLREVVARAKLPRESYIIATGSAEGACTQAAELIQAGLAHDMIGILHVIPSSTPVGAEVNQCGSPAQARRVRILPVPVLPNAYSFQVAIANADLEVVYSVAPGQVIGRNVYQYLAHSIRRHANGATE